MYLGGFNIERFKMADRKQRHSGNQSYCKPIGLNRNLQPCVGRIKKVKENLSDCVFDIDDHSYY